jgi:hypothetical protein
LIIILIKLQICNIFDLKDQFSFILKKCILKGISKKFFLFVNNHVYNLNLTDKISNYASSLLSSNLVNKKNKDKSFNEWLAGLIDGDGYFVLTKKGYTSFEITMGTRDKKALNEIKSKYGGTIKLISNAYSVRYKLKHKKGLILLLNDINGLIRNPIRLLQMNKLCHKYNIELKYPEPLNYDNG